MSLDVPSPIDLRVMADALAWEASAMEKRPWRLEFFDAMATALKDCGESVLELGSGPGFLAEYLLARVPASRYVMLDFSASMHELARRRLGAEVARVAFFERSFKDATWSDDLGLFGAVVTNQAVHELRHKRYAPALHGKVRTLLPQGRPYLVCDHFAGKGGMGNSELYMTVEEQVQALRAGGFDEVSELLRKGGMVLLRAT
jgi:ubiquinone/menaquinone biosynthesis C-methylase UbiE